MMPMPPLAPVTTTYITRTTCRHCLHADLDTILALGPIVPSTFPFPEEPDAPAIPMTLVRCLHCGFVQLAETVDDLSLYRQYWYISGTNEIMRAELADVVRSVGMLQPGDTAIDIGANDGTLLSNYPPSVVTVAFEPAQNLIARLSAVANVTYNEFFPGPASQRLAAASVRAVTSIAMFYDLEDPRAFVHEVDRLLTADGVWVVQFQDLAQQVETTAFDNCCFEHRGYYSLATFAQLLEDVDLHVVHAERRRINGGSLRIIVQRRHVPVRPLVESLLAVEALSTTPDALARFAWRAQEVKRTFRAFIEQARQDAEPVDLYAASTKSSTLLQYCGVDHTLIRQAAERTPEKWGRVTSGTRIPIVSEAQWRQEAARLTVLGAYQFADAFLSRESGYLEQGGSFLIPLPTPRVVYEARHVQR